MLNRNEGSRRQTLVHVFALVTLLCSVLIRIQSVAGDENAENGATSDATSDELKTPVVAGENLPDTKQIQLPERFHLFVVNNEQQPIPNATIRLQSDQNLTQSDFIKGTPLTLNNADGEIDAIADDE